MYVNIFNKIFNKYSKIKVTKKSLKINFKMQTRNFFIEPTWYN